MERVDAYNTQAVYDEVGETRYACPHMYAFLFFMIRSTLSL